MPCDERNRHFTNAVCFKNHKRLQISKNPECEAKESCREYRFLFEKDDECYMRFCSHCLKKMELEHRCYTSPLSDKVPRNDRVLHVFYDFETTQNTP
jgi:hypothetical protein